jgi:polysaccharide export outer membrane protein
MRCIPSSLASFLLNVKNFASVFVSGLLISGSLDSVAQDSSYVLGPSDVIAISVYEETDLSFDAIRIGDSGVINYPFLGELRAAGNTISTLEFNIRRGLVEGEYLINPDVSVRIVQYRPFYISGEVASPGSYPFEPGLTLRKAISIAGGFTERAARRNISILAENTGENDEPRVVDNLDTNLQPGDIVTVEERFF